MDQVQTTIENQTTMQNSLETYIAALTQVDKTEAVNNENVSRLYLGSSEADSYTYTLLPGQVLVLSNDYYNDVPLKWAWVYDRLGYYFRGTVTEGENPG